MIDLTYLTDDERDSLLSVCLEVVAVNPVATVQQLLNEVSTYYIPTEENKINKDTVVDNPFLLSEQYLREVAKTYDISHFSVSEMSEWQKYKNQPKLIFHQNNLDDENISTNQNQSIFLYLSRCYEILTFGNQPLFL